MANLRSYSATFEETAFSNAAVARYRFNEGSGTDALDSVDGLNGAYRTGAAPGATGSIGDGAASFDGASGFVLVDTVTNPSVNEPLLLADGSFEMWFTLDSLDQVQTLFAKDFAGRGTGGQVAAIVNESGRLTFAMSDATDVFTAQTSNRTVAADEPTHLVANFGADGMHVFVNGVEVASNAYTGGLNAGQGNFEQLVIGAGNGASTSGTIDGVNQFVGGTIDEYAIYDRPLSDAEVGQLFEGGVAGTVLSGTPEADELVGGSDDEVLSGGRGADLLKGGQGDDQLAGGIGDDELRGGAGSDDLDGKGGRDVLAGGAGDDLLRGGGGGDSLSGASGADELTGNRGRDTLDGGAGDDVLDGGSGQDVLRGGAGSDTFQIGSIAQGVDQILDFEAGAGNDILDLSAVLDFGAGDEVADFVRLEEADGNTAVAVDANGGGDAFTTVFSLVGSTGLDVGTLASDGNLQLTAPTS